MTQCGGDEALHWSAGKGSICYESWRGANGAILHNNALLCTFSTRLREHNIHRCWQLNNRCTQKNVIFLLNSIMLTQLWILNLQEMDYRGCMSWRHANKWHEDIHLAVSACARVCEDCKIYGESCRGGLGGSYVGDLIKNLVCKNRKAKAIHFCAKRHHESDQQEKTNAERRGCLMHAVLNNGGPTAAMEETCTLPGIWIIDNPNTTTVWGLVSVYINIKYILWILERRRASDSWRVSSKPLAGLQRVPLQWDTQGRYAARLPASEAQ